MWRAIWASFINICIKVTKVLPAQMASHFFRRKALVRICVEQIIPECMLDREHFLEIFWGELGAEIFVYKLAL